MSALDADDVDLLALAGDSSSDESDAPQATIKSSSPASAKAASPKSKRASPPADAGYRVSKRRGSGNTASKPTASGKQSKAGTANRKRKSPSAQLEKRPVETIEREGDDGEATLRRSSSPQSAPMSQSTSSSGSATSHVDPSKIRIDGIYTSETDKAKVMALPEGRREQVIAGRSSTVEKAQQNHLLMQLSKDKDSKAEKQAGSLGKGKRKADAADLHEETQPKTSRQKTRESLVHYNQQREQREAHNEQNRNGVASKNASRKKAGASSDPDSEDEGEVEKPKRRRRNRTPSRPSKSPPARDDQPADLKDFSRAKIGRIGFAKYCFYPGFEDTMTGCFVRIKLATDARGNDDYRMAQIKRFTKGRPYAFENENGRRYVTDRYAVVAHGKAEREFPFIFCSDQHFTENELERYKRFCHEDSLSIPSKTAVNKQIDRIHAFINKEWTPAELQEKLEKSGVLSDKMAPFRRRDLLMDREDAIKKGDEAAIAKIDAELNSLNPPKLAFGTSLQKESPKKDSGPTQAERTAELHARNSRLHNIDARNAQLAESVAAKSRRQAEIHAKKRAAAKAAETSSAKPAVDGPPAQAVSAPAKAEEPKKSTPPPPPVAPKPMTQQERYMEIFRFRERQEEALAAKLDFGIEIPTDI